MVKVFSSVVSPVRLIEIGVLGYLLIPVFLPLEDIARAFFFLLVMPATIWLLARRDFRFGQYRDFFVPFAVLAAYIALSALLLSHVEFSQGFRRVRWLLEVVVWVIALFVAIPEWKRRSELYGRVLVIAAGAAALAAIVGWCVTTGCSDRLSWVGYLKQSIQGPSLLICYWLLGVILLLQRGCLNIRLATLCCASYLLVMLLVIFSASRGPLISILLALPLLLLAVFWGRRIALKVIVATACVVGISLFGLYLGVESIHSAVADMLARDTMSIRVVIWRAVFEIPPPSIVWGWGAATDLVDTAVGQYLFQRYQNDFSHVHNSLLNVYFFMGLAGVVLAGYLFFAALYRGFQTVRGSPVVLAQFGIFLIAIASLHLVEAYRLISAPNPDWVLLWLMLVFIHSGFGAQRDSA